MLIFFALYTFYVQQLSYDQAIELTDIVQLVRPNSPVSVVCRYTQLYSTKANQPATRGVNCEYTVSFLENIRGNCIAKDCIVELKEWNLEGFFLLLLDDND